MTIPSVDVWSFGVGGCRSYLEVVRHVHELLSETAEGGQQETHGLICSEASLTEKTEIALKGGPL